MKIEGQKVLVTGSEGFIGSHLTEALVEMGADVTALVQYNSFNNWGWIETLDKNIRNSIEVVTGDIREMDGLKKIMAGKHIVFHLAALIAIPYSYFSPMAYVKTNVEGTLNVMQACLDAGVLKIVHTSTSEVYGTARYVPIDEDHPLQGQSPYSGSKIGADKIVESFYRAFNLPVTTIRPFNTYGPRQSARAVIPTIIVQALTKGAVKLGAVTPTRDFTFVKDTVQGFIKMAENDDTVGHVINIGSGFEISIGQLADKIATIMGKEITIHTEEQRLRPEKSEVNRLLADNSKAKEILDWKPEYTLDQGLAITIEWIKHNLDRYKAEIYNL
ncbi:NAD-dependent 4,6-dehydratase LegB [Mahella sp.]|uniref:NAD-dependent 4,6-dehydratase LegB n=1 Tax=Mahella sp. TaxID=2798721 RepID=UPI0025C4F6DB|nr:NAD-dependent 4,6-dehydratase LegB [Mahella sp.]MBZ4666107.1 family NAD(P)-dependent oxidoreductase [Mahella sp.]